MTIQIPTSESGGAGLPDPLALARMAAELFAVMPSNAAPGTSTSHPAPAHRLEPAALATHPALGAPPAYAPVAPGTPSSFAGAPAAPAFAAAPASPSLAAAPAAFGAAPSHAVEPAVLVGGGTPTVAPVAPASQLPPGAGVPRSSNATPGVPEAYAAALPGLNASAAPSALPSTAASPFYFLADARTYPAGSGSDLNLDSLHAGSSLADAASLQALLADLRAPAAPAGAAAPYYFLEGSRSGPHAAPAGTALSTSAAAPAGGGMLDIHRIRRDFPILAERVNGKPLVWFDNAATTQKPQCVMDRISTFYAHENSNIHRAAHALAARATDAYEAARQKVTAFLGAASADEIIFVRGATEAINLIAKSWGAVNIAAGDEIVVSHLEHHANIVPWQQLAAEKGAVIRVIPVDDSGQIRLDGLRALLGERTRIVSVTQVSNALGTVTPIQEIVAMAHSVGAVALVDGAQAVSHMPVNVQALDADFYVFSGHKVFGPTGIGVVYGKKALLDQMPPWQGGGNMIVDVTFEHTVYHGAPARFEAGTGNIADAVGLGAAIDYVQQLGMANIGAYEHALLEYATHGMQGIPGLRLIGTAANKASVLSFVLEGYKTEEVGEALNREGIAVRSGHHCAQPILRRFGLEATVRPSLAFYNTCEEVDRMVRVVRGLPRRR